MKNASESLADVRRWICDNLSNGDAGRLCNMLSSVSRHISEIETKNKHLHYDYVDKIMYISTLEQKIVCMDDENTALKAELNCMRDELDNWESTHVVLPKDADGESVCIGDVMEWPTTGETFEVVGIGDGVLFYVDDGEEKADWTGASTKHHHHVQTVEDVLREFAEKITDSQIPGVHPTYEEAIAEYAKRLTLAGDAE